MTEEEKFEAELEADLAKRFEAVRMQGVLIGWNSFAIQAIEHIKDMHSIKEVKAYFKAEKEKTEKKLGFSNKNVE